MPTLALPNGELVAQAWLGKYAQFPAGQVAGSLAPIEKWTQNAFVTARALAAGSPNRELSEWRGTVVQVDFWAARPGTVRPLWGVAMNLAERLRQATFRDNQIYGKKLEMPVSGYGAARVFSAYLVTEPTRVEGDPSGFAHITCDLAIDWTV